MDVQSRRGDSTDLEFLVDIELTDEGVTPGYRSDGDLDRVRELIASFIDHDGAVVAVTRGARIGSILWRLRDLAGVESWSVFRELDRSCFPADGAFAEIFQLWVDPQYRRRGIATMLERAVEMEARSSGAGMIYTHTEARHEHVLALNHKLGYREVRRGPIWDAVVRVSLIKRLA
jgi:GNAT superfamily N-acetyltransferase